MPMSPKNQRFFMKKLYANFIETITLLKRNPDQQAGTVTSYKIFGARHSYLFRIGEPHNTDLDAGNNVVWHIPREQLDRIGVTYINQLDRIIDKRGRYWQPEADTAGMTQKFSEIHVCVNCKQVKEGQLTTQN